MWGADLTPAATPRLDVVPCDLARAFDYVRHHHRHLDAPPGGKFSVGVACGGWLVGVAIAGRPIARMLDDGITVEIARVATDGTKNACSMLYGAIWRAARALGYQRGVTYTLPGEPGTSLRAAGWTCVGITSGGRWSRSARARRDDHPTCPKVRWEIHARPHGNRSHASAHARRRPTERRRARRDRAAGSHRGAGCR